jgi:hypothetical protein
MGGTRSTHGDYKCVQNVLVGILEGMRPIGAGVEWIEVAQNRMQWWALANTIINLRVR